MTLGYAGPKPGSAAGAIAAQAQRIRVRRGASIVLVTATPVLVEFNVENYKNGITHDVAVNAEDITIVTAGYYAVAGKVNYSVTDVTSQAARSLLTRLLVNAAPTIVSSCSFTGFTTGATNNMLVDTPFADVWQFAAGDVVNVEVGATFGSGSAVVVAGSTGGTYLALHRLS